MTVRGVLYHVTCVDPNPRRGIPENVVAKIEREGLHWKRRGGFTPVAGGGLGGEDFNPEGVYALADITQTRRFFPRSRTALFRIDARGLPCVSDKAQGGDGSWRITAPVPPERIELLHVYEPFEKALSEEMPF